MKRDILNNAKALHNMVGPSDPAAMGYYYSLSPDAYEELGRPETIERIPVVQDAAQALPWKLKSSRTMTI